MSSDQLERLEKVVEKLSTNTSKLTTSVELLLQSQAKHIEDSKEDRIRIGKLDEDVVDIKVMLAANNTKWIIVGTISAFAAAGVIKTLFFGG